MLCGLWVFYNNIEDNKALNSTVMFSFRECSLNFTIICHFMRKNPIVVVFRCVVFFLIWGLVKDHNLCVLTVFCGENSSKKPIMFGFLVKVLFKFFKTVFLRLQVFCNPEGKVC